VTDTTTSTWPPWETLTSTFKDSFPAVEPEVYNTAGEVWQNALAFARTHGLDESDARAALMAAVVTVSKVGTEEIKSLSAYLFTSYERRILETLKKLNREASLDSIGHDVIVDKAAANRIEEKVLLEEIVACMDLEMLTIYEGLVLGYSFEELAVKHGKRANALRSIFSKKLRRIADELNTEL
jgi:DNA-directed RNA polymerase specialized sigma24 family protein